MDLDPPGDPLLVAVPAVGFQRVRDGARGAPARATRCRTPVRQRGPIPYGAPCRVSAIAPHSAPSFAAAPTSIPPARPKVNAAANESPQP